MKYLIVVLVVAVVGWIMLRGGARKPKARGGRAATGVRPEAMVVCGHCGVHLPRNDAVEDSSGVYCSEAHRLAGPAP